MATDLFPDVEKGFHDWLKVHPDLTPLIGGRVFSRVPPDATEAGTFPCMTLQRIGGNDDDSDVPMDNALLQFEIWGSIADNGIGHPLKDSAEVIRRPLRQILKAMCFQPTTLKPGVVCHGTQIVSDIWIPGPNDSRPRYSITALVYCTAS